MVSEPREEGWNEKEIVRRLRNGDEGAFLALTRRYREKIYGIALGITLDREESRDIVQDVLVKVWEKIHAFKGEASLATWIHRITVNQSLNWKRRWKRRFRWMHLSLDSEETHGSPELGSEEHLPERLCLQKEVEQRLWWCLEGLPAEARAVFVLKELEGLSYDEIGKAMGIKRGTVSSRLFHARRQLRECLGPYLEEVQGT